MSRIIQHQHRWANWLQSLLLIAVLLGISCVSGSLLLGELGLWIAGIGALGVLLFEPVAAWRLTLYFYRARPIYPAEAPGLWRMVEALAEDAGLPAVPVPYYVPSAMMNAFAIGSRKRSAVALTDGLLKRLNQRELTGVIGHEIAHIAHGDLRVMGLADYVSRLTHFFSGAAQLMVVFALPLNLFGDDTIKINFIGLAVLIFSPHLALLAQMGLARVREYDADLASAALTGDPLGLASALAKIERSSRSWLGLFIPGWGNPEPSWLRSHPATEARIERLRQYAASEGTPQSAWQAEEIPVDYVVRKLMRHPRWRIGGLWR